MRNTSWLRTIGRLLGAPTLSPWGLVAWAALFVTAFAVFHLLGWRESTTFLTGTVPEGAGRVTTMLQAACYLPAYFGVVVATPVLLIAALLSALTLRWLSRRCGQNRGG